MDAIDYKILKILQKNARETASNISKEIHLSVSAVIERIRKMEETGVIKEYTIIVEEIHRQVMSLPGVDATRTHVVLKNVKNIYSAIRRPDK